MTRNNLEILCTELREALRRELESKSAPPLIGLVEQIQTEEVPTPFAGQMWIAKPPNGEGLATTVVLTHVSSVIRAVLATEATFIAGHDDIAADGKESPTGSELLLCAWSDTPIDRSSLLEFVGMVAAGTMKALLMFLQRELTGGYVLRALQTGSTVEGEGRVFWSIFPTEAPDEVCYFETGPRILDDDDPRNLVRQVLLQGTHWMSEVALEGAPSSDCVPEYLAEVGPYSKEDDGFTGKPTVTVPQPSTYSPAASRVKTTWSLAGLASSAAVGTAIGFLSGSARALSFVSRALSSSVVMLAKSKGKPGDQAQGKPRK